MRLLFRKISIKFLILPILFNLKDIAYILVVDYFHRLAVLRVQTLHPVQWKIPAQQKPVEITFSIAQSFRWQLYLMSYCRLSPVDHVRAGE